jgi:ribonuclease D
MPATESGPHAPAPVPLLRPADGLPDVVADRAALDRTAESLAAGTGPLAVDAERASGFRWRDPGRR